MREDRGQVQGKKELRVNRRIRVPSVRVSTAEGTQLGIMATSEALNLAEDAGLDLVELSPFAKPPVCKIIDYGKFKYEKKQRAKESKRKQMQIEVKEIKFRPKIEEHDFNVKMLKVTKFISEGKKVKLGVYFKGREIIYKEEGQKILNSVVKILGDKAVVEVQPKLEGKNLFMLVSPISKK